jgi:hypothetical protein
MGNLHRNAVRILYKMYDISSYCLLYLLMFEWCKTLERNAWMDEQVRALGHPDHNTGDLRC